MESPKFNKSSRIGRLGISILTEIVESELFWLLRINHQEDDYGIDAFIDIISEEGRLTGKSIAVQVKSGESYFRHKTEFGWKYYGEMSHLNYYLNIDLPVLIILVDTENRKAYRVHCDPNETEKHKTKWSITVPYYQQLTADFKNELLRFVSPEIDYVSQLENYWNTNKMLKSAGRLIFVASKDDIINENYLPLIEGLNRLEQNKELLYTHKENVEIAIDGYNDDTRELYEIKEVRNWVQKILDNVEGLSFFLVNDVESAQFLKLILSCNLEILSKGDFHKNTYGSYRRQLEVDSSDMARILEFVFSKLNSFCIKNNIPETVVKEISDNITDCFSGGEYKRQKNNKA